MSFLPVDQVWYHKINHFLKMMESSSSGIPDEEASYRGLVFNTPP